MSAVLPERKLCMCLLVAVLCCVCLLTVFVTLSSCKPTTRKSFHMLHSNCTTSHSTDTSPWPFRLHGVCHCSKQRHEQQASFNMNEVCCALGRVCSLQGQVMTVVVTDQHWHAGQGPDKQQAKSVTRLSTSPFPFHRHHLAQLASSMLRHLPCLPACRHFYWSELSARPDVSQLYKLTAPKSAATSYLRAAYMSNHTCQQSRS